MSKYAVHCFQRNHGEAPNVHPVMGYYVGRYGTIQPTERTASYQLTFYDTETPPEGYRYGREETGLAAHVCEYTEDAQIEKLAMPYPYRYSMIEITAPNPAALAIPRYHDQWSSLSRALGDLNLTGIDGFYPLNIRAGLALKSLVSRPIQKVSVEVHREFMRYLTRSLSGTPEYRETVLRIPRPNKSWEAVSLDWLIDAVVHQEKYSNYPGGEDVLANRFEKIIEAIQPHFKITHVETADVLDTAMQTLTLHGDLHGMLEHLATNVTITINMSLLALTELIDAAK